MKPIEQGELYQHLSGFLKKKGVELHEGPYPGRIEQVCRLLTETINATQGTLERARKGMDRGFEQVCQVLKKKRPGGSKSGSVVSAAVEVERGQAAGGGAVKSGEGRVRSAKSSRVKPKVKVAKPKRSVKKAAAGRESVRKGKKKAAAKASGK